MPVLAVAALVAGPTTVLSGQVPTFEDVAGYDFGERIVLHHQMLRYLETLDDASDRVTVEIQGESWGHRSLPVAIVTSEDNHLRLDEIRRTAQRLGDPRQVGPGEVDGIVEDQPAVLWLGGAIHGFELSGTEGLLMMLERLTTQDDPETREVLENTVILIDPILNPDGRDAHAHHNHENVGRAPSPERDDWSNDFTGWEGLKYRTGYYYFDINRDWFAHTQPETRSRIGTIRDWRPQVVVDAHEMSPDVEFFFDPPTDPYPPFFPDYADWGHQLFNQAYVAAFDEAGYEYMTGERYNYFYPGYTTAWGSYQGAVGMLYEQGSTRGLTMTRADGSVRTLRDAAEQQFTAAWAAAGAVASQRREFLERYHDAHRADVEAGEEGYRRYLVSPEAGDPSLFEEFANLLIRNGVEVERLTEEVQLSGVRDREGESVGSRQFPSGTLVVEAAQPRNRFIRTLLEPDIPVPEAFLELARERIERGDNPRFYDITAWSLPLFFNLAGFSSTDGTALPTESLSEGFRVERPEPARAGYAYILDGRYAATAAALHRIRKGGYRAALTLVDTQVEGEAVPAGSGILRVGQNPESLHDTVREVAESYGVTLRAVDTGVGDSGYPSLGSGDVIPVRKSRVALVGEEPFSAYSFGFAWYTLDRQYEVPVTILRARSLASADLRRFDTIVLPEVSSDALASVLGSQGKRNLEDWVRQGGTLVTLGSATDFARGAMGLTSLRSWYDETEDDDAWAIESPGPIVQGSLNPAYWLSAGLPEELPYQLRSDRIYLEPEGGPSGARRVVGRVDAGEDFHLSGHAWDETLERVPGSVFAYEERVGDGRLVSFSEDLNFRGYWRAVDRLFLNAALLGPSAP